MSHIGDTERKTQNDVVRFFRERLGYTYLGDLSEAENGPIMPDRLRAWLKWRGVSETLIEGAVDRLTKAAANMQQGLYAANKEVYSLLKYGAKVRESADGPEKTVYFIDFNDPLTNSFAVAEEVTVRGDHTKRPDVVLYVNGIALAVLELKKSTVSVAHGIRQNLTNQQAHYIDRFFTTIQICAAGNTSEGLRYGTLLTPEKYYLEWKPDGFSGHQEERDETDVEIERACEEIPERLFRDLSRLFTKERFLDLVHNYTVFDNGVKKLCRPNQFYAIKRAQSRLLTKNQGGIVWHTQGSGKSLTMVWLAKWVLSNLPEARVLIVTDQQELDAQIESIFKGVDEAIVRAKSCADLIARLNSHEDRLICSLIHKFGKRGGAVSDKDYDKYIEELKGALPKDFCAKGNFVVFVDECHRTQSGKLHEAMKAILPKAAFIGFTGTPLLKKDKKTSLEIFGGYIHTYKFDEGVRDEVILDLRYEARDIDQDITAQDKIDAWFDIKTQALTPRAKAKLKQHWGNLQKVFSSRSRLDKIANDIIFDFATKSRLADGRGNALLVAGSVYSACKFYEIFQSKGFTKCAVISSYVPSPGDLRTEIVSDEEDTEGVEKYKTYLKMVGIDPGAEAHDIAAKVEAFENEAKRKFIEEPANMKLLIVVDKLLAGFDAPPCTYLYIDKHMQDHGLFQAICRVNRLDGDSKDFGYIVDYKQLFGKLTDAVNMYTSDAFAGYDAEDVKGLLKDRTEEAKKYFFDTLEALDELCEGVEPPMAEVDYIHYFCGESGIEEEADEMFLRAREKLYSLVSRLLRAYEEFKPRFDDAEIPAEERGKIEERVTFYLDLRDTIGRASGDFIDLKQFEPGMRHLIDNYIVAADSRKIGAIDDFTLLDFITDQGKKLKDGKPEDQKSAAETIENNIRRVVVERRLVNPAYYAKMSEVLEKLILERREGAVSYEKLLAHYMDLASKVSKPEENERYPESICKSGALRAFYDNFGEDETLALNLHQAVMNAKMDDFRNNPVKENRIKRALLPILNDEEAIERAYKLIVQQEEY